MVLRVKRGGKFKALRVANGVIERKLFKFDNPGQLILNVNTMLYAQMSKKIIKESQVRKTQIFKFDVAKVVQSLKDRKEANECLLSKKGGQIDNKALSLSSKYEISFLQHVKQTKGNDLVAFLARGQSFNTQELHLASLVKNGPKSDFVIHEFKDPVDQLYVKDSGQGCFITTAISGENIIIFNHRRFEKPSEVTIIPANTINTFSDFVNIINGRLTPSIISSSTVAPITTTEKVETSTKTSTTAITDTTKTDAVETTHPSTAELTTQTSTVSTTATTTSKATTVTTEAGTSTAKSSATVKLTTAATTSQATTVERVTMPTHEPITSSEETTHTAFTIPSTRARELTTSASITTLPTQQTSSPHPVQHAITGPEAGIIAGSVLGAMGIVIGIIGFIVYKYVQKHRSYNAAPVLELSDLESQNSSSGELFISNNRTSGNSSRSSPEIVLDSVSVESGSRSSSPSPEDSINSGSRRSSLSSNTNSHYTESV